LFRQPPAWAAPNCATAVAVNNVPARSTLNNAVIFLNVDFMSVSPLILGRGCRFHRIRLFAFTSYSENCGANL
jgi:hypothetical protein